MYLADVDLKILLKEINIVCSNPEHQFVAEDQIQPASIDLRLDNIFWKPKRSFKSLDLRKSKLLEISPRILYSEISLIEGEPITLNPGELLSGRIYEEFTVPKDCVGKIEGRSSFARLGLGIHISSGFINPNWRGHMPLQLVNHSKQKIKLYPYIPICQLSLVKLTQQPERLYGVQELQSKYMNDDGGPSYWWRDKRIKSLQKVFQQRDISLHIQKVIFDNITIKTPDILVRFEKFILKRNNAELSNSETLLNLFTESELRKKNFEEFFLIGSRSIFTIFAGFSLKLAWDKCLNLFCVIWYILAFLLFLLFLYTFMYDRKEYLTRKKYDEEIEKNKKF